MKEENIEDIYDGNIYKKIFNKSGFFCETKPNLKEKHISFQLNTDGVSLFKSSNVEIWPLYLTINELPPSMRYSRKHRIFAGIWFGQSKPCFKTFLHPLYDSLSLLFETGITVMVPNIGEATVKAKIISATLDAPAKSALQNFSLFSGFDGCPCCLERGETCWISDKGHKTIYPFNLSMPEGHAQLRTHSDTIKHAKTAQMSVISTGKEHPVFGVKGLTWMMYFPGFDIIKGMRIDYMHAVLIGVQKMLLKLWFDKGNKAMPWYIGNHLALLDQKLRDIKVPNVITRLPRSLNDVGHWKASELRNFLLYYSIPILSGTLPELYFNHYLMLVHAMYLLLQNSISAPHLQESSCLLRQFHLQIRSLLWCSLSNIQCS